MRRARLALSFVTTVSCGGRAQPTPPEAGTVQPTAVFTSPVLPPPAPPPPPSPYLDVTRADRAGACVYTAAAVGCGSGGACNPPPVTEIACTDAPGEPSRAGWIRVLPQIWTDGATCRYHPDYFCRHGLKDCEPSPAVTIPCERKARTDASRPPPLGGEKDRWPWIPSFVGRRADGTCTRFPAHWRDLTMEWTSKSGSDMHNEVPKGVPAPCPPATPAAKK